MAGHSTTKNDEDLARRLQFEEQFGRPVASRKEKQEQEDMELARQYAQMDLATEQQASMRHSNSMEHVPTTVHSPQRASFSTRKGDSHAAKSPRAVSRRHSSDWGDSPSQRRMTSAADRANIPRHPFDYSGVYLRDAPIHPVDRRSTRSQSPPTSPPQRIAKDAAPRGYMLPSGSPAVATATSGTTAHQRASSFNSDHEFLVRSSAYQLTGHDAVPSALERVNAVTAPTSTRADSQLEYARQLQLQAFANLQRSTTSNERTNDEDMILAQRLQDLENRGMGQLDNSESVLDRQLLEVGSNAGLSVGQQQQSHHARKQPSTTQSTHANEELERLISESGINLSELPDHMLSDLFGSHAANHIKHTRATTHEAATVDPIMTTTLDTQLHPNSPRIKALRAALSGVSAGELEDPRLSPQRRTHPKSPAAKPVRLPVSIDRRTESDLENSNPKTAEAVPVLESEAELVSPSKQRRKRRGFLGLGRTSSRDNLELTPRDTSAVTTRGVDDIKPLAGIPGAIPPPPGGSLSVPPPSARLSRSMSPPVRAHSSSKPSATMGIPPGIPSANHTSNTVAGIPGGIRPKPAGGAYVGNNSFNGSYGGTNVCSACGLTHGTFLKAFNRRYHPECFRCKSCNGKIDPNDQFKYTTDANGKQHPHHRECFLSFGVKCCICRQTIPATPDGRVPFVKHPFFDNEEMCIRHADEYIRRCCGCQRFEPYDGSFIDLMDGDRCVCPACCRSVVVDADDVKPLWASVLAFFENELKLTVWGPMRDIPTLLMGYESLKEQMKSQNHIHAAVAHPMTSGLCLTERSQSQSNREDVVAILCLTGLPRYLTGGVLAHQAMHAWIKLHPEHDVGSPLPDQIEEGVCQLIAMLFLTDGQVESTKGSNGTFEGPTDEKLRQYFKYTIERETSDIYGTGFRMAAAAYCIIGIEELMAHVFRFKSFPLT